MYIIFAVLIVLYEGVDVVKKGFVIQVFGIGVYRFHFFILFIVFILYKSFGF